MGPLSSGEASQPAMFAARKCSLQNHRNGLYRNSDIRRRRLVLMASVVAMSLFATPPICRVAAFSAITAASKSSFIPKAETEASFATFSSRGRFSCRSRLFASKGGSNNKNLSSSERERRDEERRRNERKDDVVIGKTSANREAKDLPINPEVTEQEYLLKASKEERLVHEYTEKGMHAMKSLRLDLANQCFEKVFEIRPEAYLWQAGIVKFYLDDFEGAAKIFASSAILFETRYGPMGMGPASEERIWRNASELKYTNSLKKVSERKQYRRDKLDGRSPIAQIDSDDDDDGDDDGMGVETRKVHRLARELFDASVNQELSAEVVARAKLLSLAGNEGEQKSGRSSSNNIVSRDIKKRKINACYFLALHFDVKGEIEESKKWIKTAFKLCNTNAGKSSDIVDTLPLLHMTARDWFDDDPYDDDEDSNFKFDADNNSHETTTAEGGRKEHMSDAYSDPVLEASIMEDVEKMKFDEIRAALRIRGISSTGSKETLKERLFISLMDDAGYQSGFAP